ncbi:MAG: hypothetical protein U0T74_13545 [Chitinophagales bacterium]
MKDEIQNHGQSPIAMLQQNKRDDARLFFTNRNHPIYFAPTHNSPPSFDNFCLLTVLVCFFLQTQFSVAQNNPFNTQPSVLQNQRQQEQQRINQQNQSLIHQQQNQPKGAQQREEIREIMRETKTLDTKPIQYSFTSFTTKQGANFYLQAFDSILPMLQDKQPLNLKRAVFLTENAYYENKIKFSEFDQGIKAIVSACRQMMKNKGYSAGNNSAKIMTLFQFFTDTTFVTDPTTNKKVRHNPFFYDFQDYGGYQDWTKMFVMKVLSKGSGQCHSLPMLFLVCCEELGAKAYLSFSPNHTFVRYLDNGRLRNIELTNGRLTSDSWILGSGYIKGEALKNKIYLDTLDSKKVVVQCLEDLAMGYSVKYGYDEFMLKVLDTALVYHPNNINTILLKSNYYTYLFDYIATQKGRPALEKILQDSKAKAIYDKRNELYDWEDNNGFNEMPAEAYQKWLGSVNDMKQIQQDKILKNEITKSINLMQQK